MGYRKSKIQVLDFNTFNNMIQKAEENSIILPVEEKDDMEKMYNKLGFRDYSYLFNGPKWIILATRYVDDFPKLYYFALDGKRACLTSGSEFYGYLRESNAKWIIPDINKDEMDKELIKLTNDWIPRSQGKYMNKQSGILECNKEFLGKKVKVWAYDLNSAYAATLYNKIPDTRKISGYYRDVIKGKEIGFILGTSLTYVDEGYAEIIFELIDSPQELKDWILKWYEKKKNPKSEQDKLDAKACLTYTVGYMQYTNPWLRAYVVESCNWRIRTIRQSNNWALVNTDCIYSTVPMELNMGNNIGEFKLEEGYITTYGVDYVLEDENGELHSVNRGHTNPIYKFENNRIKEIK